YRKILKDEDIISNIAEGIMWADIEFNGKGNIYGYRKYRAMCEIKKYFNLYKKQQEKIKNNKAPTLSLSAPCGTNKSYELSSILEDKNAINPVEIVLDKEAKRIIMQIIENLPATDKKCMTFRFIDKLTYNE